MEQVEKKYDPLDTTLKFVNRDDLDPTFSEDSDGLRAEMSCGHAVGPDYLTVWCLNQLKEGKYLFRCPALVEGTNKLCNKLLSYQEVCKMAALTVKEMEYFEETIARLAAAEFCEIKPCPKCRTHVERTDLSNLCVHCTICTADQKKIYYFCWQCQREWKVSGPRSDHCENDGCINKDLQLLQTCKTIMRACPKCGLSVEHSSQYCKNITCPRCHIEFCFVCLKLKLECNKTSSPYKICPSGVAPRQTSIPVWQRK
uniref:RING-type domain-containing protein n=1 Tax=Labrus bergylta TaxID=56723 RepID=A0A3Q3FW05_9LABR